MQHYWGHNFEKMTETFFTIPILTNNYLYGYDECEMLCKRKNKQISSYNDINNRVSVLNQISYELKGLKFMVKVWLFYI